LRRLEAEGFPGDQLGQDEIRILVIEQEHAARAARRGQRQQAVAGREVEQPAPRFLKPCGERLGQEISPFRACCGRMRSCRRR